MESSRTRPASPRGRGSDPAGRGAGPHEGEYDLLTAALIGALIGASATFLLRRPQRTPSRGELALRAVKQRSSGPMRQGARGARWAAEHLDPSELRSQVGGFVDSARQAINDAVEDELRDLRKSIRRQRRKLGV